MTVDLDKNDMIILLKGIGWPRDIAVCEAINCGKVVSDGHNEKWVWNEEKLLTLPEFSLFNLYENCKRR